MMSPASTNIPTRSSAHVNCFRCAIAFPPQKLRVAKLFSGSQKLFQVIVGRVQKVFRGSFEINLAPAENHHVRRRRLPAPGFRSARLMIVTLVAVGRYHALGSLVKAIACEAERVLDAV